MSVYLLELYVPRTGEHAVIRGFDQARAAVASLRGEGSLVSCLGSIFVPDDETWMVLYEAESVDLVREAAARAGLAFARITEARMFAA